MKSIKYFFIQIKYNIKNAKALSSAFWVGIFGMILNNLAFFAIWFLFMKATGPINGWTSLDVFGMLGVSVFIFGIVHTFFYGVVDLPDSVEKGSFDSILLAPVNPFLKISSSAFSITALGDLLQGLIVIVVYGVLMKFSLVTWFLFLFSIFVGVIIFICIRFICSLIVFFIRDGDIISSQLFEIFLRPGLYPGSIFPNKLKIFFMTVIPTLITSSVPIDIVKQKSLNLLFIGFLVAIFWVFVTYLFFKKAIKRYESGNLLR